MTDTSQHAHHVHAAHAAVERGDLALAKIHYAQAWRCVDVGTLIIGDSHVYTFLDAGHALPIWLGAITMHRVARDAADFLALTDLDVRAGLDVVFCFGEIDARLHILQQAKRNESTAAAMIDSLVERYLRSLVRIVDRHDVRCFVTTPVPPQEIDQHSPYATQEVAPLEERVPVTRDLAGVLAERAHHCGFGVIDLYHSLCDGDGCMNEGFASDEIHAYTDAGRQAAASLLLAAQGGSWKRSPLFA